jgi:alpha-beta hydrolase superfamily lysophospholipase
LRDVRGGALEPPVIVSAAGRKQAVYFEARGRSLFGFYHPPGDGSWRGAGVVLCNPIGTDQTRSDRTYRHLAERLAAAGFACLRFDLFATGDSGGGELEAGLVDAWLDDVEAACVELRRRSGAQAIALVGLRLGASLAMTVAAARGGIDSLVLWSPCISGSAFVGEVTKLHKLYARIEPQLALAPPPPADGEEALGWFLPRGLVEDLSRLDLLQVARRPAARTLVIDGGNTPGLEPLLSRLRELDAAPELRTHTGHKFLVTVSHRALVPEEVLDSIVGWLSKAYPATTTERAHPHELPAAPPSRERVLVFGARHPLFGILTRADPTRARPDRPTIFLSNAGCVNRAGPHRMYVQMARRWAQLGFDVLRIDLSGIGDSPSPPGVQENVNYPPSALDDLREAMAAVGSQRFIVAGLCSGGDYAFQLGIRDERVAAAWLLNPRTFCVLALAAVESGTPPTAPVDEVPRSLRAMAERGVDTLLVVSGNDPGVAYADAHAAGEMSSLTKLPAFHRVDIKGADHSFTPVAVQAQVSDLLTERLIALYPAAP